MTVLEETKVSEAKDFRASFFLLWDFYVLAITHGKEKGKDGELRYGALQLSQIPFCNLGYDMTQAGMAFCCFSLGSAFL